MKKLTEYKEIERLKQATGIETASCRTCSNLHHYSEGDYGEYQWFYCGKFDKYQHLKSFPFKKEMPCWKPSFWESKFAPKFEEGKSLEQCYSDFKRVVDEEAEK